MLLIETVRDEQDQEEEWQGSIQKLKSITSKRNAELKKSLSKTADQLQARLVREMDEDRIAISKSQANVDSQISAISAKMNDIDQ